MVILLSHSLPFAILQVKSVIEKFWSAFRHEETNVNVFVEVHFWMLKRMHERNDG